MNAICPLHNVGMIEKEGQYGPYFSHTIQGAGYCNGKKITPFKVPQAASAGAPIPSLPKPRDYEAEGRGKVRFGFAIEAYKAGKLLDNTTMSEINRWTDYVMDGNLKLPQEQDEETYP